MEKTLIIDDKEVRFKSNGSTALRYKVQFGKDYFKEILKMLPLAKVKKKNTEDLKEKDLETLDFEVFFNIAWVMAKTANPNIPEPIQWLDGFEEFPIGEILPELQDLIEASLKTTKKK